MLDIDILRDHGVQSTLIQSSETSRTMFVAVFNDIGDIHMINSVCRKQKYHQILQRRALMSEKRLCAWKMVSKHFSDLCKLHLKKMRKLRQFSAHGISSSVS